MKKHKENLFARKFQLLSSQESAVINWSSSDSSDFENVSTKPDQLCNFTKKTNRKRKRKHTVNKNISNLDITVIDVKDKAKTNKSGMGVKTELIDDARSTSPILESQYFSPFECKNINTSPIITSKTFNIQYETEKPLKSPILILKTASPKISPHVRKELFKYDANSDFKESLDVNNERNTLILNENHCLDRRKLVTDERTNEIKTRQDSTNRKETSKNQLDTLRHCRIKVENDVDKLVTSKRYSIEKNGKYTKSNTIKEQIHPALLNDTDNLIITDLTQHIKEEVCVINETPEVNMDDSMAMLKMSSRELSSKVKNYFDNHFSSENPSQQTISEIATPRNSSKTSDDIEIISIPTQIVTNRNTNESLKEVNTIEDKKEKKIRYKKDGLAYRLNNILKKQTASISLWQHERYLAANSNFVLPKEDFLALRIYKVCFKYGCYSLEAMDLNDDSYIVLINKYYAKETILSDSIMKLYEPYNCVDCNQNFKMIINVTKFEFVTIVDE